MSKRDDFLNTLSGHGPVDSVPVWELEFHPFDRFVSGRKMILGAEFMALSADGRERALHSNAEIIISVATELDMAAVTVPSRYWEVAPGHPAYWIIQDGYSDQVKVLSRLKPKDLVLVGNSGGVMSMPGAASYLDFSYKLFDAPDEIDALAKSTYVSGVDRAKMLVDLGCEVVFTASDIADNHGPFFKPKQMERFILPYLRDWAAEVHKLGAKAILHSDGNLTRYLDVIADSGINALQAIDPVAGMTMRGAMDIVKGRIALAGNVDCGLLLTGTPDAIQSQTETLLKTCGRERLVLGGSNALQYDVPAANYRALHRARESYGQLS